MTRRQASTAYIGAVVTLVAVIDAVFLALGRVSGEALAAVVLGIVSVPVAVVYASALVRKVFLGLSPARDLPRAHPGAALADGAHVLFVVPTILFSSATVEEMIAQLEKLSGAHDDPRFHFAILGDFADAPSERMPGDEAILSASREAINRLNALGRDRRENRFFLLHRRRVWSNSQRMWIGWERKRGKLVELYRCLTLGRESTTFRWAFGAFDELVSQKAIPYLISLDENSWLDPESAWELIRTAAHPSNRAACGENGYVESGYAIFQPTLVFESNSGIELPNARRKSAAMDESKRQATSFPFDPLGNGVHNGAAALYDVSTCAQVLDGAFPEGSVLQHDLLEGFIARTGECRRALVVQPRSRTYFARLSRGHRWLRGTFQALRWTAPFVRVDNGRRITSRLDAIDRFYVAELALRQLEKPASAILLCWGWLAQPASFLLWTVLVCPPLTMFLLNAVRFLRRNSSSAVFGAEAFGAGFGMVVLVIESKMVLDALARALWRMAVSRRRLLDWVTHRASEAAAPQSHTAYWLSFWPSAAVGATMLAAVTALGSRHSVMAMAVSIAWVLAPSLVWCADRFVFDPQF